MFEGMFMWIVIIVVVIGLFLKYARVIQNQSVYVIERLGKYQKTIGAGFHLLLPFLDKIAYKHTLKEQAIDVPPQICITQDNISVEIDGVLYMKVVDAVKASYGITNYRFAIIQLAQTMMRSEIGKLSLDNTFESRENINAQIVTAIDEASDPWGIKVTRYEIKNIDPPESIKGAMEKQMRAEREKREKIALSEGDKIAKINRAEGDREEAIKKSEGERTKLENEAKGQAAAILEVAEATAQGIKKIADAINQEGGQEAVNMNIAKDWIKEFGKIAHKSNTMIVPTNVADLASVTGLVAKTFNKMKDQPE